jgi:two-component system, NarL family, response regulator NreC
MRILVADDAELVRRAVRNLLSEVANWEICGEAADGPEALQKARELQPNLVLLDINMPSESGLKTAGDIRRELPSVKILIMSLHDAQQFLAGAIAAGADGCLDKTRMATDLVPAIQKLFQSATAAHSVGS